jgi:phospholipid/cholesterol/gamma-HCH transport system substrate-binding protein
MNKTQRLHALYLGLFLLGCFLVAQYYFSVAGTSVLPKSEPYRVQAVVPTGVSLATAADVSEAGVDIGRVHKLGARGGATVLELEIDDDHAPIYRDASVLIRAKSVAGENYVELSRGRAQAGALPSGGVLPIENAGEATQIDELFSVFDDTRQRDLQRIVDGLGTGLRNGGGDLNRTVAALSSLPIEGSPAAKVLLREKEHVAKLVDSFGRVTGALGARGDSIRLLTRQAKATAEAVADRDDQLRATLDRLPDFLRQARATSGRLNSFSVSSTPVLRDMRLATEDLIPTVEELRPATRRGQAVVSELDGFARGAAPAMTQLKPFASKASGVVAPLEGFLRQLNPLSAYLAPYSREMASFFSNDAGSFQYTDATGHAARILLPISRSDLPGVLTAEQEQILQKLQGQFDTRGTNAYPKPGEAGGSKSFTGSYPRLQKDPPYTR